MKPLRIAFATPEYVTERYFDGGLAHYLHRVTKSLAGMGHEIHVLTLSEIDEAEFQHDGVTVHRIKLSKWCAPDRFIGNRLATTPLYLNLSVKVYRKLKSLHSQQPLHLVQFPNYSCCGLVSICCLRVPHVLRASSYEPAWHDAIGLRRNLNSWMVERLEGLQFRMSRNIFAPSHNLQRMLMKQAHLRQVRVIRSPFYVEDREWDNSVYDRFLRGKKYLLFFGRFQLHKGFQILAEALPRFLEQYPDSYAALVGRDMDAGLTRAREDDLRTRCGNAAERVILLDRLPHRQLYPVIAGAHLVVLPSLIDNFPNACLEAMGLGKVVIGTLGTSFDELISEGETGFLVPANNPEALSDKIISTWRHPRLAEIGAAARERILEFSPERTVEALLSYYREVLQGSGTDFSL